MKTEKIYSPVNDTKIQDNISGSPMWKECYAPEEISDVNKPLYCYWIKFDGLKPVQVTKKSDKALTSHTINLSNDKKGKGNTRRYKK